MITYQYNENGIRIGKKVGNHQTTYLVDANGTVLALEYDYQKLIFAYDSTGRREGFSFYDGNSLVGHYYYLYNAQGDVTGILNQNMYLVVSYTYDSWGKQISCTGDAAEVLGTLNPFRYRGYIYDEETKLYYLNSRYYDPETGRFLNADDVAYLGADGTPISYNLFAYCKNNPVNFSDDSGTWPKWATKVLIGVAVIAVAAVLTVATAGTGTALACFAAGALYGSVTGAAVGAATGAVTGAVMHRIQTGSWQGAGDAALNAAADGFMGGAVSGFIVGGLSSPVCFIAGTAILTATGSVNIEDIEAGDYVWASNPETGEVALKQVVQTFVNETNEFIHLVVDEEEITCTTEHPFYSPVKGWIAACELRAGDILVTVNGEYVVVEYVEHEILENPVTVYNFEVEDFHTYYVGDTNVLVHNLCKQQLVAGKKTGWNATVSVGGEMNHARAHAHIFYKNSKLASIDELGEIIVGELDRNGRKFVKKVLPEIAEGIQMWWYYGRK